MGCMYNKAERTKKDTKNFSVEISWKVATLKTEKNAGG
jgi:hypothetical protein